MIEWFIVKFLHILSAVFWMGGAITITVFVLPALKKSGASSKEFMEYLTKVYKLPLALNISSSLTVICGLILYWKTTMGFQFISFHFPGGIGLFHGIIFGLLAFILGHAFQSPNAKRLSKIMSKLEGPPSPEELNLIHKIQKRIVTGGWLALIFMLLSLMGMISIHF